MMNSSLVVNEKYIGYDDAIDGGMNGTPCDECRFGHRDKEDESSPYNYGRVHDRRLDGSHRDFGFRDLGASWSLTANGRPA